MKPSQSPLPDDRTAAKADSGFDRIHRDMETIFRPVAARPPSSGNHHVARLLVHHHQMVPVPRPRRLVTGQAAALVLFGLCQMTILTGAFSAVERGGMPTSQDATSPAREAAPPTTRRSPFEIGSKTGTASEPEEGPDLFREEAREGRAAVVARPDAPASPPGAASIPAETSGPRPVPAATGAGEAVVRSFYDALGRGDGGDASAHVIAEKRSSRAFSPEGISRFYGGMEEPLRLTTVTPLADGRYRVGYRYAVDRSRCSGEAVVSLTLRDGRQFIRSIQATNGC